MQLNSADFMGSDNQLGTWNNNAFSYGMFSDYSVPSADWLTPFPPDLEASPLDCDTELHKEPMYPGHSGPCSGDISPMDSPVAVAEADSTEQAAMFAQPSFNQRMVNVGHGYKQQHVLSVPGISYLPQSAYYPSNGLGPVASGPMLGQANLYPSPPGTIMKTEPGEPSNVPYMLYMNSDHIGHAVPFNRCSTESANMVPGAQYGAHHTSGLHQAYAMNPQSFEQPIAQGGPLATPMPNPKYEVWTTSSVNASNAMGYPTAEQYGAEKQDYLSDYSPSSSLGGGSSAIKTEVFSDVSQSPPPPPMPQHLLVQQSGTTFAVVSKETRPAELDSVVQKPVRKAPRVIADMGQRFVCPECSRTFARQCGLTQHIKWNHSGSKPFRCFTCGKCFATQEALVAHTERHTSTDKPFQCTSCPKAFFHKNDLRRHMYQHTGAAPHICKYCRKTFARKDHCQAHEYSHERKAAKRRSTKKGATDTDLSSTTSTPSPEMFIVGHQ